MTRWLIGLILSSVGVAAVQAGAPPNDAPDVLRYRRVFVTRDEVSRFGRNYMPMQRSELQQRLREIADHAVTTSQPAAGAKSAWLYASWRDADLVDGILEFQVDAPAGNDTAILLNPLTLAIGQPTWQKNGGESPALAGVDARGRFIVIANGPGRLRTPWSLRGHAEASGAVVFHLALPPVPRKQVFLDLPVGTRPECDHGFITGPITTIPSVTRTAISAVAPGMARWRCELGGTTRCQLRIVPKRAGTTGLPSIQVMQQTNYRAHVDGLDVDVTLKIDVGDRPLDQIVLDTDKMLEVTRVTLDDDDATWQASPTSLGPDRQLRIVFPKTVVDATANLRIQAVASLRTNELWRLPRVHIPGVLWRQGVMQVAVDEAVELCALQPHRSVLEAADAADNVPALSRFRVILFDPGGAVDVFLRRRSPATYAAIGTTIQISPSVLTAATVVDLDSHYGALYQLEATIPAGWTIDGIDSVPADVLQSYRFAGGTRGTRRLHIELAKPVTLGAPARLNVRAHREHGNRLRADAFRPVQFTGLTIRENVVALATDPALRMAISGDLQVQRIDPSTLAATSQDRHSMAGATDIAFADDDRADDVLIQLSSEVPVFAASVDVAVTVAATTVRESYRIVGRPESTPMDQFLVHLSETREGDIHWALDDPQPYQLQVDRLDAETQQQAGLTTGGETWRLVLPRPSDRPVILRGWRETQRTAEFSIALASLPAATSQEGTLVVDSTAGIPLAVDAQGTTAVTSGKMLPDRYSTTVGRFEYQPARSPRVLISAASGTDGRALAWAWDCRVISQYGPAGAVRHNITYYIENRGARRIVITPRPETQLATLAVDGKSVDLSQAGQTAITVSLPPRKRFFLITLATSAAGDRGHLHRQLRVDLPRLDVPVLDQHWMVWLPPGFEPTTHESGYWPAPVRRYGWRRRLLGPLAARDDAGPVRLLSPSTWSAGFAESPQVEETQRRASASLELLGTSLLELREKTPRTASSTWYDVIRQYVRRAGTAAPDEGELWVDSHVLEMDDFDRGQSVALVSDDTPEAVAAATLARANLVLVAHGHALLLTSTAGLSRYADSIDREILPRVFMPRPNSPLADQLATTAGRPAEWVPLAVWNSQPLAPRGWQAHIPAALQRGLAIRSRRLLEVPLDARNFGTLDVANHAALGALGWSGFWVVVGMQLLLGQRWRRTQVYLIISGLAVTLVAPGTYVPITAYVFLGAVAGMWLTVLQPWVQRQTRRLSPGEVETPRWRNGVVVGAVLLGLWILTARCAVAQQTSVAGTPASPVYQIITPVDEQLKPVGTYDYLPLDLYDALHRTSRTGGASAVPEWLFRSARYRATIRQTQDAPTGDLTQLFAVYELQVTHGPQRIRIPWPASRDVIAPVEARLDSRPLELQWDTDGRAFSCTIASEGSHQLELLLRPLVLSTDGERYCRVAIPRVQQAYLEVVAPFDTAVITSPKTLGAAPQTTGRDTAEYALGPVDVLEVRWPAQPSHINRKRFELQQLEWLQIQPDDDDAPVTLEARVTARTTNGPIRTLLLETDKSLRLLSIEDTDAPTWDTPAVRDEPDRRVFTFPVRRPASDSVQLHARFAVKGIAGLGNLIIPRISCPDAEVTRRWLAVSLAPELELIPNADDGIDRIDASEFLNAWGGEPAAPRWVGHLTDGRTPWTLAVHARPTQSKVQQQLSVHVDHAHMKWIYRGDFETTQGHLQQCRFLLPPASSVENATSQSGGTAIDIRQRLGAARNVTVFFGRPMTGRYSIELRGQVPLRRGTKNVPLPTVEPLDTTVTRHLVNVYRGPDVRVTVTGAPDGTRRDLANDDRFFSGDGRRVASIELPSNAADDQVAVQLKIAPNRPTVSAKLISTMSRPQDQWQATAHFEVNVTDPGHGVLDVVRLEVPPEWQGPFIITPFTTHQMQRVPGTGQAQLLLWPDRPVNSSFRVTIKGPLTFGENERVHTPDVMPLDIAELQRYCVLPTQTGEQRIDWKTSGLQPVRLETLSDVVESSASSWAAYRVWSRFRVWSQPRAIITSVRRRTGAKRLSLVDVHVGQRSDGSYYGVATFRIEPAGAQRCTLVVPDGTQLIRADIERVPATLRHRGKGQWSVNLGATHLPQQLTVVFHHPPPGDAGHAARELVVPWISDLQPDQTLWTIRGIANRLALDRGANVPLVSRTQQCEVRFRETAATVAAAADILVNRPADDVTNWYLPWALRLAHNAKFIQGEQATSSGRAPANGTTITTMLGEQKQIANRLRVTSVWSAAMESPPTATEAGNLWDFQRRSGAPILYCAFDGARQSMPEPWTTMADHTWIPRLAAAMVLLLLSVVVTVRRRSFALIKWPSISADGWGAIVGLVWWAAGTLSWLGALTFIAFLIRICLRYRRSAD